MIKEKVRAVLKLLLNIDTDSPSKELLKDKEDQQTFSSLLDMIDDWNINEAENRIYEITSD